MDRGGMCLVVRGHGLWAFGPILWYLTSELHIRWRRITSVVVIVGVGVRVLSQVVPFNEDCMIQRLPLRRTLAYADDSSGPSLPFGN